MRSKRWPVRVFTHFLEASVVNAHILYRDSKGLVRGEKGYTLLSFYEMLIDQLATSQLTKGGWPRASAKDCRKEDENKALRFVGRHKIFLEKRTREKVGKKMDFRLRCKVCKKQTTSGCKTCNVGLCLYSNRLDSNPNGESCFDKYHDPETPDLYS